MKRFILLKKMLVVAVIFLFNTANSQINWQKDPLLNKDLPVGVEVFRGNGSVNGTNIRATYTVLDPRLNSQLELDVALGNNVLRQPQQFASLEPEKVWVTINGGFFGGTVTNSHITQNGVVTGSGVKSLSRGSQVYYPTRAAFGIGSDGTPSVNWLYNVGTANTPYIYPLPSPNNITQSPQPQPSAGFPAGGAIWDAYTAIGGGPMLLKNGTKNITDTAEMFDEASGVDPSGLAPRTGIGYTTDGKYYLLVVDGRNSLYPGASANMMADIFLSLGCTNAINLDGGGSSCMVVNGTVANVPSDAAGVRAVSSVVFIKQKNWVFDTEFPANYKEVGGAWSETGNAGFWGPSKARFVTSGDGSRKAYYLLNNLPPAFYKLSAWWVASSNRSNRTPFIIHRAGSKADTVYMNQSINGSRWNLLGSYQLSAGDTIEVSGAGQPGALVTADAIQLVKDGESNPVYNLSSGNYGEYIKDSSISFPVYVKSVNSGVKLNKLIVNKALQNGTTSLLDSISYTEVDSISYILNTTAHENTGSLIKLVFSIEDNYGRRTDTTFTYKVTPLSQIRFTPDVTRKEVEKGKPFTLQTELDTRSETNTLRNLKVYKRVSDGARILYDSVINIGGVKANYQLNDIVKENVKDIIHYDFILTDSNNDTASKTFTAIVEPGRGDFRIVVISDLNSSYGDITYEWQVDSIMQRIPRLWKPNLVVSGGDLIAGQSTTYDSARVAAMWTAFDIKIAKPLRDNNIPHAFTMGNHDAAVGFNNDRVGAKNYWRNPANFPGWHPVDTTYYPYYHSFTEKPDGDYFFVSWEASDANLSPSDIEWTTRQFQSPQAQRAKYKILIGHMPFYGVAQERDGAGNILTNGDELRKKMEDLGVKIYISGHHHAYYPGQRGNIELLNTGAAGSGARKWTFNDETAPNTVTLIDFFSASDSLVYTTYEIKQLAAENMTVFNESRLPKAVFGTNGFTHNRSLKVKAAAGGNFSSFNVPDSVSSNATGSVALSRSGNNVIVSGTFSNLKGRLLKTPDAISVFTGVFPKEGELLKALQVRSSDGRTGTFEGMLAIDNRNELLELISVGALYVVIKTDSFANGEIRSQLFQEDNIPLSKALITSQISDSIYQVRDIPAFFRVAWTKSTDADIDAAIYTYQLASDSLFAEIVLSKSVGVTNSFGTTQTDLWQLMEGIALETEKKFYHRVISSDGSHVTLGDALALRLIKTEAPLTGDVVLQSPSYQYECARKDGDGNCVEAFANATAGHGVVVDKSGKVWYHPYSGGLLVRNPDGSFYKPSSPNLRFSFPAAPNTLLPDWQPGAYIRQVTIDGNNYTINLCTGLGLAADGNILLASSSRLIKLDAITGEPLRQVQLGSLGLSNPTTDSTGRTFLTRVLNNQSFILKESESRPTGYDTVASEFPLQDYPGVTRSSAIAYEGNSIYLPSASGNFVNRYTSTDGINFRFSRKIDLQGTCNSVHVKPGNKVYIVSNKSGNTPPILEFRDFSDTTQIRSWSFPLTDIAAEASDLRGISMNEAADTLYVTSLGSFKVYKYHIPGQGGGDMGPVANAPYYKIIRVKGVQQTSGVADSLGVYCILTGTIQNDNNFSSVNGYDFVINDSTAGIRVFNAMPAPYVNVVKGDSIAVRGFIRQSAGQIRIVTDSLVKIASRRTLQTPLAVDSLQEQWESSTIALSPLLLSGTEILQTGDYSRLSVKAYNSKDSFNITFPSQGDITGYDLPSGEFAVRGIEMQYKEQAPFIGGYFVDLRDNSDVSYTNTVVVNGMAFCSADTIKVKIIRSGKYDKGNQFRFQMSDQHGSFTNPYYNYLMPEGTYELAVPAPAITGSKYRARVVSTLPALTGGDNGNDLDIALSPNVSIIKNGKTLVASGAREYQWYIDNVAVAAPLGIQSTLDITRKGNYYVVGKNGRCTSVSNKLDIKMEEVICPRFNNLSLTPNPVSDVLHIKFDDCYIGKASLSIYDINGVILYTLQSYKETVAVDLSVRLPFIYKGLMYVQLQTDQSKVVLIRKN